MNPDSILDSTKQVLGVDADYTAFDVDITLFVNTTLGSLQTIGVGPYDGFVITDNTSLWTDFVSSPKQLVSLVKSYVCLKTKMAFDPPATSFAIEALNKQLSELEFRLNVVAESSNPPSDPEAGSFWWDITGQDRFPPDAARGDLGWDSETGDVWENIHDHCR